MYVSVGCFVNDATDPSFSGVLSHLWSLLLGFSPCILGILKNAFTHPAYQYRIQAVSVAHEVCVGGESVGVWCVFCVAGLWTYVALVSKIQPRGLVAHDWDQFDFVRYIYQWMTQWTSSAL